MPQLHTDPKSQSRLYFRRRAAHRFVRRFLSQLALFSIEGRGDPEAWLKELRGCIEATGELLRIYSSPEAFYVGTPAHLVELSRRATCFSLALSMALTLRNADEFTRRGHLVLAAQDLARAEQARKEILRTGFFDG